MNKFFRGKVPVIRGKDEFVFFAQGNKISAILKIDHKRYLILKKILAFASQFFNQQKKIQNR